MKIKVAGSSPFGGLKSKMPHLRGGSLKPKSPLQWCVVYYVVYLAAMVLNAAFCPPQQYVYDLSMARAVLAVSNAGVGLWLIHHRRHAARLFSIITFSVILILTAVDLFACGEFASISARMGPIFASLLALVEFACMGGIIWLMSTSPEIRSELRIHGVYMAAYSNGHSWDKPMRERIRTWEFWRDLIMYFIVFSFIGHWAEILFCRLIIAGVFMGDYDFSNHMLWDQWLFPFSAEGTALAAVVLFLHPVAMKFKRMFPDKPAKAVALSFLVNGAVCTSIDFMTGMVANQHYELWDYRALPFNFMGQVCLQNSMVYTIAATLVVWLLYPVMDGAIRRLPKQFADALFVALVGLYVFLAALHFIDPSGAPPVG